MVTDVSRSRRALTLAAVADRVPKDFLTMNNRAFDIGLVLGSQYRR